MIKVTVLFGHPTDPDAFEKHYADTHGPLTVKMPYVKRIEFSKFAPNPDGSQPLYYRMAEMWYDDMDQLQASTGAAESRAVRSDLKNFATGGVTFLVSETEQIM